MKQRDKVAGVSKPIVVIGSTAFKGEFNEFRLKPVLQTLAFEMLTGQCNRQISTLTSSRGCCDSLAETRTAKLANRLSHELLQTVSISLKWQQRSRQFVLIHDR